MASKLDLMLEAERRGILPNDKQALLNEARKRGLVQTSEKGLPTIRLSGGEVDTSKIKPQPVFKAQTIEEPKIPTLKERFVSGLGQKEIPQPEGFEMGDIAEFAGREGLPAVGAVAGAMTPMPGGAALGAAGGRALQKGIAKAIGTKEEETALEAVGDILLTGVIQGTLDKAFKLASPVISKVGGAVKAGAVKVGAQLLRAGPGIKETTGKTVLNDLGLIFRAPSVEQAGGKFAETINKAGVKTGPEATKALTGKLILGQEAKLNLLNESLDELAQGTLTTQKAIVAREQTSKLLQTAKFGDPNFASEKRELTLAIKELDDFLEPKIPGYAEVRKGYREAKIAEEFKTLLPRNKNLSPNVLRSMVGAAGLAAAPWTPLAVGAALAVSPAVAGLGIGTLKLAEMAGKGIVKTKIPEVAVRAGVGAAVTKKTEKKK